MIKKININSKETRNAKAQELSNNLLEGKNISSYKLIIPFARDVYKGNYKPTYKRILIISLIALAYIICPYDIIPEAILGFFGVADDLGVAIFAIKEIFKLEKQDYIKWLTDNNLMNKQKELYA